MSTLFLEFKSFGIKSVIHHVLYKLCHSEMEATKMLKEREKALNKLSEKAFKELIQEWYETTYNMPLSFENPVTFSEKINLLKLCDENDAKEFAVLADKYMVREWVSQTIGEQYVIPQLAVWDSLEQISFDDLPNEFVLKMNHGSAMNYVVKNKKKLDVKDLKKKFAAWVDRPFEAVTFENHYKLIPKKIIAETYIKEFSGGLYDYKIHCFHGEPKFIQCIGDRNLEKHTGYQANFDLNWNKLDWIFEDYPQFPYNVEKPKNLQEMIEIAKKLSAKFNYVRVDLYDLGDRVLFGEMTFTPASGMYPYKGSWTRELDIELGEMI